MTYEGIEFAIRAGLGRDEWAVTIHFPDASEPLARSSVVKFTGTRGEANCDGPQTDRRLAHAAAAEGAHLSLILPIFLYRALPQREPGGVKG